MLALRPHAIPRGVSGEGRGMWMNTHHGTKTSSAQYIDTDGMSLLHHRLVQEQKEGLGKCQIT